MFQMCYNLSVGGIEWYCLKCNMCNLKCNICNLEKILIFVSLYQNLKRFSPAEQSD